MSDYSMSFADKTFPEFFSGATATHGRESSPKGAFQDDGIRAWLEAIRDKPDNVTFEGVWSEPNGLQPASVPTPANVGTMETFTPKVCAKVSDSSDSSDYGTGEASMSFPYGCGRGMASIFHVHGGDSSTAPTCCSKGRLCSSCSKSVPACRRTDFVTLDLRPVSIGVEGNVTPKLWSEV